MKKRYFRIFIIMLLFFSYSYVSSSFAYVLTGQKWQDSALPVSYYINQSGSDDVSDGTDITAIQTSFSTWTGVATTYFRTTYAGTTASNATGTNDSTNVMGWAELNTHANYGNMGASTLAVCTWWFNATTNYISDSDIGFNGVDFTWGTTGAAGVYDIQNIATHEIGHFLGLTHPTGTETTMYASAAIGETKKRTLDQDDIDGVTALYTYTGITTFAATPVAVGDVSWTVLTWKNPAVSTFLNAMIRYRTDGTYPTSTTDGTLLVEKSGSPSASGYYSHTGVSPNTTYYYSIFAYDSVSGYADINDESKKSAKPIGLGGKVGGGGGGCFIATACYGDKNAQAVKTLREFRDRFLLKNNYGRESVRIYYYISPYLASIIADNNHLKIMARFILEPIVVYCSYLNGGK